MVCFSIYSDISIRIKDCSSSNKNQARDLANSVFPTPVGPIKMKDPRGLCGSPSPERERRIQLEIASTASSWPMTRLLSRSSVLSSLSFSPSKSLFKGMRVQRETTPAISSSSTSSLSIDFELCSFCKLKFWASNFFCRSNNFP